MTTQSTARAKHLLGIDRLVLQIHDASFPVDAEEDCGRGSPYSRCAERFFEFAAKLGFDTVQFGPQGMTQRGDSSPYDGTLFSRNPLSLPLGRFVREGRLSRATFDELRIPAGQDGHRPYSAIFDAYQRAAAEICKRAEPPDREEARRFLAKNQWVVADALYGALCVEHGADWWREWGETGMGRFDQKLFCPEAGDEAAATRRLDELRIRYAGRIEDYALIQWLLEREHRALRDRLASLGVELFADLQVGLSAQDVWRWQGLFLPDYRMGAPPSRTNPAGQPWGYAVLDPDRIGTCEQPGPVLDFVKARLSRLLEGCDGVRIDHPHGWVDPWVYLSSDADAMHAVQHGARLFSSPNEPDHPRLSECAIARAEQVDTSEPRHGDHRVVALNDAQVHRYGRLVDAIVDLIVARGGSPQAIACEVLSTLPYPVGRVLEEHALGRFRVTQKAKLDDPKDVYRIENARPEDWVMLGTHDTPTIWELAGKWRQSGDGRRWGEYLSPLLTADPARRTELAERIAGSEGELIHAMFTAMLASRARHVSVFFADLFGLTERYNRPGEISDDNWNLRLPCDFDERYARDKENGRALDIARCLREACERHQQFGSAEAASRGQ